MDTIKRLKSLDKRDMTIGKVISAFFRRVVGVKYSIFYNLPWGFAKDNKKRLTDFKDKYKGKRCFVIANGPSLKKIDFSLLKNELTIGMNRFYLMKEINDFMPTYLVCVDKKSQIEQFHDEFNSLEMPCFFNFDMQHYFSKKNNQYFIKGKFSPRFSKDIVNDPCGNGKSVTYACIQLAYYMGFSEVYLIGKDHSYATSEKSGKRIESDGNEGNHFIKGYYKPGQKWDAPDYKSEEYAYRLARNSFENDGRVIMDATINGKLDVFEKIDFKNLFML